MSLRRRSSYDSPRPRSSYANSYVKEIPKSRAGNNNATRHADSLRVNTYFPDAVGAMTAHCTGKHSPHNGGCLIVSRSTPPRTAQDDSEAMLTFKPQSTPLTNLWRFLGGLGTLEAHKKKPLGDINTALSPGHSTNTYSARSSAESSVMKESLFSTSMSPHSTSLHDSSARSSVDEDIVAEARGTEGTAPSSPHICLQTKEDEPWSLITPSAKSTSHCNIDETELSPLLLPIPSDVDLPPTMLPYLGTPTSECLTFSAAEDVTASNDNTNSVNEVQQLEQQVADTTSSSVAIDQPTADSPSVSVKDLSPSVESGRADVGHVIKGLFPTEQGAMHSHTQSTPETIQQTPSIDVSVNTEPPVGKERREVDFIQDGGDELRTQELEGLTIPGSEPGVAGNGAVEPKEMIRSPDRMLDLSVSDGELTASGISKAEYLYNTAEHHVLAPEAVQNNATGGLNEQNKISTCTPTANAGELHVEAPITSVTPPEPTSLEAMGEPSALDASKASNATEHIVSTQSEATDESRDITRDPSSANAAGAHDEVLTPSTAHPDESGLEITGNPASAAFTSVQVNSDPAVPPSPTMSSTTGEAIISNAEAGAVQAKPLSKSQKRKQKKAKQKERVGGENDNDDITPPSSTVPNTNEMQDTCNDSADSRALDSSLSNVSSSKSDSSRTKELITQENASSSAVDSVALTSRKDDNADDHASATSGKENQASPTVCSDQREPEPSSASEDALSTSKPQTNGLTIQISPSDGPQSGNPSGLRDGEKESAPPDSSASSPTDAPPTALLQMIDTSSSSPILPIPESNMDALSSETDQNSSTAQVSQSDSLQLGNPIAWRDGENETSPKLPSIPESSEDDLSTNEKGRSTLIAQSSQSDSENLIKLGDRAGQTTPDTSASGSSPTGTPPAAPPQTIDDISNSPNPLPILESSRDTLSTGDTHYNSSTPQSSQSGSLQTGDLIELGDVEGSSSSMDSPLAASNQTAAESSSSLPILPFILESSDDALSTIETHQNSSTTQFSQSPTLQIGILVDLGDSQEPAAVPCFSASDSMYTASAAPHQMTEGPLIFSPASESSFEEILNLLSPHILSLGDIRTDDTTISTVNLTEVAELRLRNQKLEEECRRWREMYEESERKCNELEKKQMDPQKCVEDRTAAGVD